MRVLLVNPPAYTGSEPYFDNAPFPRTALAVLAGYLRHHGEDVHVLDCKFDQVDFDGAMEKIAALAPDMVGLTAMTNEIKPAHRLAQRIKAFNTNIKIVIGGVHFKALPEQTLREFPEFDFGIDGEGQEPLLALVRAFPDYEKISRISGLYYLDSAEKLICGGPCNINMDLDSISYPAWDTFRPAEKYIFQSALGCPFTCHFCQNPNGRKVRRRSAARVIEEIELCLRLGKMKSFQFGDEIFTIDQDHVVDICNAIIERGIHKKVKWYCVTHLGTLKPETVRLMKRANCFRMAIGVESADEKTLKEMGKGLTLAKIRTAARMLHEEKMEFETLMILGHPNETRETIKKSIDFSVELNPTIPIFGIMVPYPGSEIRALALRGEAGYKSVSSNWDDYTKHVGDAVEFVNFSRRELEWITLWGYLKVFIWNLRFIDLLRFIWKYRGPALGAVMQLARRFFEAGRHRSEVEHVHDAEMAEARGHLGVTTKSPRRLRVVGDPASHELGGDSRR